MLRKSETVSYPSEEEKKNLQRLTNCVFLISLAHFLFSFFSSADTAEPTSSLQHSIKKFPASFKDPCREFQVARVSVGTYHNHNATHMMGIALPLL